jgi:hypothetical protein
MVTTSRPSPEDRPLSAKEAALVIWMLEHGDARAAAALPQVERARVISRCGCGCASVDFSVDGVSPLPRSKMEIVSNYCWFTERGNLCGASVFLRAGGLAGIDVWSIDGVETPRELPDPEQLRPHTPHLRRFDA